MIIWTTNGREQYSHTYSTLPENGWLQGDRNVRSGKTTCFIKKNIDDVFLTRAHMPSHLSVLCTSCTCADSGLYTTGLRGLEFCISPTVEMSRSIVLAVILIDIDPTCGVHTWLSSSSIWTHYHAGINKMWRMWTSRMTFNVMHGWEKSLKPHLLMSRLTSLSGKKRYTYAKIYIRVI